MMTTHIRHKRTFNDLLNLFNEDKLTMNYLNYNLTKDESRHFYKKITDHPNKYFVGKQLSKNQKDLLKNFFYMVRCKRNDCEYYHSEFTIDSCNKCVNYEENQYLKYKKTRSNDLLCSICILDIEKNTKHAVLECNHFFHKECIRKWLTKKMNCPCCRRNFDNTKQHNVRNLNNINNIMNLAHNDFVFFL